MTDTPITDAAEYDPFPEEEDPDGRVVPAAIARQLERHARAMASELGIIRAANDGIGCDVLAAWDKFVEETQNG